MPPISSRALTVDAHDKASSSMKVQSTEDTHAAASSGSSTHELDLAETGSIMTTPTDDKPKTSSMVICYTKAVETKLFQAKEMQIQVWARREAHEVLSVRFATLNKLLSLPAALFSAVSACLGAMVQRDSKELTDGYNVAKEKCEDGGDCVDEYSDVLSFSDVMNYNIPSIIIALSALTTLFVTLNTHFDFGGLTAAHRETSLALKRFEERLDDFIQRLRLGGNHLGIMSVSESVKNDAIESVEEKRKAIDKIYSSRIENLLEQFGILSKELSNITENAPDLTGPFTGVTPYPFWVRLFCCSCSSDTQIDGKTVSIFKLNRSGMLLRSCEARSKERGLKKSTKEDEIAQNVEEASRDIDTGVESGDPFGSVFNRSNFGHVLCRQTMIGAT